MQLTASPKALASAHAALRNIPDRKSAIPVAGMFHVEAGGGQMHITATDRDIESRMTIDANGECEGVAIAPHLIEAAGRLPANEVKFLLDDRRATVTAGRSRYAAGILPGEDFPHMTPEFDGRVPVEAAALNNLFEAVRDAAADEGDYRYYLWGVTLETEGGRLHGIATNGHRMHTASVPAPSGLELPNGIIVPSKAVAEIVRMAGKLDGGTIDLEIGKTAIAASTEHERIVSKLIDHPGINWRRVVIPPTGVSAIFDLAEMVAALDRVLKVQAADTAGSKIEHGTGVKLVEDGNHLIVSGVKLTGEATDAVAAEFRGAWGTHATSGKYLRATLSAMKDRGADSVSIDSDRNDAALRIESLTDEDFIGICMPMAVVG